MTHGSQQRAVGGEVLEAASAAHPIEFDQNLDLGRPKGLDVVLAHRDELTTERGRHLAIIGDGGAPLGRTVRLVARSTPDVRSFAAQPTR